MLHVLCVDFESRDSTDIHVFCYSKPHFKLTQYLTKYFIQGKLIEIDYVGVKPL